LGADGAVEVEEETTRFSLGIGGTALPPPLPFSWSSGRFLSVLSVKDRALIKQHATMRADTKSQKVTALVYFLYIKSLHRELLRMSCR
jgi:hypothetical protein